VFQAGPWERMLFFAGGPAINFVAALVLFIVVALIGWPFVRADVTVYDIMPDSPAAAAGLQQGDIIVALDDQPVESADDFNDLITQQTDEPVNLLIERDGKQFDVSLTARAVESSDTERVYVTAIIEGMPAEGRLEVDDVIVKVDDLEVTSIEALQEYTQAHENEEIAVTVLRGEDTVVIPIAPIEDSDGVVRMGIQIVPIKPAIIGLTAVNQDAERYTKALPLGEALEVGWDEFASLHTQLYDFVRDLIRGDISASEARPVSPVGIGQIGGPVLEQSLDENAMYPIVFFAALISVALAVTNLLPIPGLDGGRILFVIIELIRGKPMEPEREGLIHFLGIMLLLGIVAITLINDIVNPIDINSMR